MMAWGGGWTEGHNDTREGQRDVGVRMQWGGRGQRDWGHDAMGQDRRMDTMAGEGGQTEGYDDTTEGQRDVKVRMQWGGGTDRGTWGRDAMGWDRQTDTVPWGRDRGTQRHGGGTDRRTPGRPWGRTHLQHGAAIGS